MRTDGKEAAKILGTVRDLKKGNRDLLRYLGVAEEDFPEGPVAPHVVAIPDTLESVLTTHWPAWDVERQRIVASGQGVDGKNWPTYSLAAQTCPQTPSGVLLDVVAAARDLI